MNLQYGRMYRWDKDRTFHALCPINKKKSLHSVRDTYGPIECTLRPLRKRNVAWRASLWVWTGGKGLQGEDKMDGWSRNGDGIVS